MGHRQTLSEAMHQLAAMQSGRSGETRYVPNWQQLIPSGSRWRPGDVGRPDCPTCLGLGYVHLDLPVGHPLFGKLVQCDCAAAAVEREQTQAVAQLAALGEADLALRWPHIVRHAGNGAAIDAVQEALQRGYGWVYLHGKPGPGKTLILKTAVAECLAAARGAAFAMWPDVLDHLRAGFQEGDYDARMDRWRNVTVLAIDEFGRARDSQWTEEAELKLLNRRYELSTAHHKGVTIFASNFGPDHYNEWLESRISDGRFAVVEVGGVDMRPAMEYAE